MGRTPASVTTEGREPREAATKLVRQRLSVLELAAEPGNAAEACRRRGMDRTSFYEWRRRFQTHGLAGPKDLPPIHRGHPQTTPAETVARIEEMALAHPACGGNRIEALLALEGRRVSAITVQKILNDRGLGSRHDRWLAGLLAQRLSLLARSRLRDRGTHRGAHCGPLRAAMGDRFHRGVDFHLWRPRRRLDARASGSLS